MCTVLMVHVHVYYSQEVKGQRNFLIIFCKYDVFTCVNTIFGGA